MLFGSNYATSSQRWVRAFSAGRLPSAKRLCSDERGVVVILFGFAVPVLVAGVAAAMDYSSIISRRAQMQTAADGAAMTAAKELTLANADQRVAEVAKSTAQSMLAMNSKAGAPNIASQVLSNRTAVEVTITETFPFMMGHYLGYPKADVAVRAVAKLSGGKRRLCMIGLEPSSMVDAIRLEQQAKITAEGCDVQSDSKSAEGIKAYNEAVLKAARTCSAGGYKSSKSSNFVPTPVTDCPQIGDPLASRSPPFVGGCDYSNKVVSSEETLNPGVYCGGLKLATGGLARLKAGVYVMENGKLELDRYSGIVGENVGFYFRGDFSVLDFDPETYVSLTAPKSGPLAGILFFEDRNAPLARKFRIASNYARKLLGTIYLSRGMFYVGSTKPVADQSAYTVVVARTIRMDAGPDLILNSNYGSTDIPVPEGVGPIGGSNVSLVQ